jgi:hypothetical protein
MGFGIRLRTLWQLRVWVLGCLALSLLAAVWSVMQISLAPPSLASRAISMASATTQVVVDTPQSTLVDARTDTYNIDALTNRAVLVGNLMATPEVRAEIARLAHVPPALLQIQPPLTPKQPRVLAEDGHERHTTDIAKLNDEYRLVITANPTVPVLRIYAATGDERSAAALANAAVDATSKRLDQLARSSGTPNNDQIKLTQFGRAEGVVINEGASLRVAALAFLITFALSCASVLYVRRVREGWQLAELAERPPAETA